MNSAAKVGEIFTKAGESFHKMADMTMMLDDKAEELNVSNDKKQVNLLQIFLCCLCFVSNDLSIFFTRHFK